jgi:SPP1 family predicted phage head-tail adaptor
MRAGSLRDLITFQVKASTRDDIGGFTETWSDAFDEWASFEVIGTREFPEAQKRNSETQGRFRIRYRGDIDCANHRIVLNREPDADPSTAQTFNIYPPYDPTGKRRELLIEVSEIK